MAPIVYEKMPLMLRKSSWKETLQHFLCMGPMLLQETSLPQIQHTLAGKSLLGFYFFWMCFTQVSSVSVSLAPCNFSFSGLCSAWVRKSSYRKSANVKSAASQNAWQVWSKWNAFCSSFQAVRGTSGFEALRLLAKEFSLRSRAEAAFFRSEFMSKTLRHRVALHRSVI